MRAVRLLLLILGFALGAPALAEPVTPEQQAMIGKVWSGTWTGGGGYIYSGVLELICSSDGELEGAITWTLRRDATGDQSRIGQSAVERVRGVYSPSLGALSFEGYEASDQTLIGLDIYRLVVADDGSRIVGMTWANGTWDGRIEFIP